MKNRTMGKFFLLCLALLLISPNAFAQFNTANIDGTIASSEYGNHSDGQNRRITPTGQDWYMSWDDTNLYIGITNANTSEAAVVYIDRNPLTPPNGGTNADGNLTGNAYDNTNFASLPFRADFVAYFKDGYREYRTANGTGGWSNGTSGFGAFATGAGNVREISIPWSAITGAGRPSSFNFFGYLASSGGYVYGQVPTGNAGATIGTAATYNRYYNVTNTANGTSTAPFSQDLSVSPNDISYLGLRHDTFNSFYRSPFGAVPTGSTVTLRFRTDRNDVSNVYLRVYQYDAATDTTLPFAEYPLVFETTQTENSTTYDIYKIDLATPSTASILYYQFRAVDGGTQAFYGDAFTDGHDNLGQGGDGLAAPNQLTHSFQLTVYANNFTTPSWLHNASVYQIFPDRFRNGDQTNDYCRAGSTVGCPLLYGGDTILPHTTWNEKICNPRNASPCPNAYGNQFYGGDLRGIQDKLDYIKGLGFDTIYLNPIFKARSNHRYDTDDFMEIAPELGGDAAFASLVSAANQRGMKLILDGVWNHTSSDSKYFDRFQRYSTDGACESLASEYRSWFIFYNNNVPCGNGDYQGWFGFGGLPELTENDVVRDFFYRTPNTNVTQYWLNRGAGGWRFDVAENISHNWWHDYRPYAKGYKADAPLIGEIFPDGSQYLLGDQLDGAMNYRLRKNLLGFARNADWEDNDNNGGNKIVGLTPSQFNRAMLAIREDYPLPAQMAMLNLIDSHDTNRALYSLTKLGDSGLTEAKQRLRLAAAFQFTYIGAPMVYYGDEAGINAPSEGNSGSGLAEDDPYNRAPYAWADESGDATVYGAVDNELIAYYTKLNRIRRQNESLRTGAIQTLLMGDITASTTDNNSYAFVRYNQSRSNVLVTAMNNGDTENTVTIPVTSFFNDGSALYDLLQNAQNPSLAEKTEMLVPPTFSVTNGVIVIRIPARSAAILTTLAPTASTVSLGGRVTTSRNRAISRATVYLTNTANGQTLRTLTNSFGFYRFENLPVGNLYTVSVSAKAFNFEQPSQSLTLNGETFDVNFVAR